MLGHIPVMTEEVLSYLLSRKTEGTYVDGTLGGAGHTLAILKATGQNVRVVGLDVDCDAIKEATALLKPRMERVTIVRENFRNIKEVLRGLGIDKIDGMVLDLGVSSYQIERPERGFSFMHDARLDMRMDSRQELSAYELVNGLSREELERIIRSYGEERRARAVAKAIVEARRLKPISTTLELSRIAVTGLPSKKGYYKIHPATRLFQALRIAVNDELENLKAGLKDGVDSLREGGRMVVISFHSLEDRIAKNTFRELFRGCTCPSDIPICVCGKTPKVRMLTKKVITPSLEEILANPRARSAKLRAVERI